MDQHWLTIACLALLACSTLGEIISPDHLLEKHRLSSAYDTIKITKDQLKFVGGRRLHQDFDINRALVAASYQGEVSLVQQILNAGGDPNHVYQLETTRTTPLMAAALQNHAAVIRVLIKGGATPNLKVDGVDALGLAISADKLDAVRALVEGGADAEGYMFAAAIRNKGSALEVLIDGGGNVNAVDDGLTLLSMAAFVGSEDAVRVLVNRGADKSAKSAAGVIAFQVVCACTSAEKVPEQCQTQICNSGGRARMQGLLLP